MTACPYCDFENIQGADLCEQCGQSLGDLHLPDPATLVERSLLKDRVGVLKPKTPVIVSPQTPISQVLKIMADKGIGCVLVVEDEKVTGIFSERDALLRVNTEAPQYAGRPVADFMTPHPQSVQADAKVAFAVHMMDVGSYRHVPVVDKENRPTGMISARDILRYLAEKMTGSATV